MFSSEMVVTAIKKPLVFSVNIWYYVTKEFAKAVDGGPLQRV